MKPATLKALNASIAHWERLAKNGPSKREPIGCDSCELCWRFDPFHFDHPCERVWRPAAQRERGRSKVTGERCPVFARTGERGCSATPYDDVDALTGPLGAMRATGVTLAAWRAAARRELAFLRSLRPKP